jgi:hypothetical protein
MVDEDGRSDPNRNIYRVLDDDYVPLKDRPIAEQESQFDPHDMQSKTPIGGTDSFDPGKQRGSGIKAWAVIGAVLLVALLISAGLVSGWISFGASTPKNKIVSQDVPLRDFNLSMPCNGEVLYDHNVSLFWNLTKNASSYELMLCSNPSFVPPLTEVTVAFNSYSLNLTDGVYYWKVMANGDKTSSDWTSIDSFEIRTALNTTGLLSPMNGAVIASTASYYSWSAVNHATLYRLQVDNSSDFSSPVVDVMTNRSHYSLTYRYVNGETYHWRVISFGGSIQSGWTSPRSFTVAIALPNPSLIAPSNSAIITSDSLVFNWSTVPGAFIYHLQVGNSSDFSSPLIDVLTQSLDYHASISNVNTTYYWRVMASNENYQSPWSSTSSFFEGLRYFLESYTWTYQNVLLGIDHTFTMKLNISAESYYMQRQENRNTTSPYVQVNYAAHVNSMDPTVKQAAAAIKADALAMGYDREETLDLALAFVQTPNIQYDLDQNTTGFIDYARYPIETLVDKVGDCDCKSVLFLSLIQTSELGYDGVLLEYLGNPAHMSVGVAGSYNDRPYVFSQELYYNYYPYLGKNYYYCETTGYGWLVGQLPPGEASAIIIPA